ncbi:hypothetical protein [Streptomyces glaucus]|uniref:Uncharacterized protein n=1 Tax=Streptomyces glaucus TaxID=284029 RepID=A0ABN3JSW8_9ACTN
MSRVYKGAVLVRTASVTTTDGIRLDLEHYRYTTESHRAAVAHREWITHTKYVDGARVYHSAEAFTGRRLDRLNAEWDESVSAMKEAGPVTLTQHSNDPQSCRWLSRRDRHADHPFQVVQTGETALTTAADSQGRNWATMRRSDFEEGAPLALVDDSEVARPVPAVAHANGTEALFGDEPAAPRAPRPRRSAPAPAPAADALF